MIEVFRLIVTAVFKLFYRVEVKGTENVPATGPCLLCSNHIGELDMFFIGFRVKRLVRWMAKEELFRNPLLRAFITWLGAFPVKRGKADIGAIRTAIKLLEDGHIVGIFPEGHRRKAGRVQKAHPGAALIAIRADVPILPVSIEGSMRPFSRIKVVFGKTFKLDTEKGKNYSTEELTQISKGILEKIYNLAEEN